jgi:hypothetical protein
MPPDLRLVENMDDEPHYGDEPPAPDLDDRFFTALGHDRGRYYVSTNLGGQVLDLSAKDLVSHGALMQLAPLLFWEMNYPTKTEAFNARAAGNSIMQACFRAGIYDPNRIRGRGAWLDGGRTVLHLGDRLIVDGVEMQIRNLNSEFIYERGRRMDVQLEQPLTTAQSSELIDMGRPRRHGAAARRLARHRPCLRCNAMAASHLPDIRSGRRKIVDHRPPDPPLPLLARSSRSIQDDRGRSPR